MRNNWTSIDKLELIYTLICVFQRMQYWSNDLTATYLQQVFDESDFNSSQFLGNNTINS